MDQKIQVSFNTTKRQFAKQLKTLDSVLYWLSHNDATTEREDKTLKNLLEVLQCASTEKL